MVRPRSTTELRSAQQTLGRRRAQVRIAAFALPLRVNGKLSAPLCCSTKPLPARPAIVRPIV